MKNLLLFILIVFCSCGRLTSHLDDKGDLLNETLKKISVINLPLRIRCDNLPDRTKRDTAIYFGKIVNNELTVLLKNKIERNSPVLYSYNKQGQLIDTLVLFDSECYIGVDSDYLPWIEINKDMTVVLTDTTYSQGKSKGSLNKTSNTYDVWITQDTTITRKIFHIDNSGKIEIAH